LQRLLTAQKKQGPALGTSQDKSAEKPDSKLFFRKLTPTGTKIIESLFAADDGLTTDELAAKIEMPSSKLPPMIRAVRGAARDAGLDGEILEREAIYDDGRPKSRYRLSPETRKQITPQMELQRKPG